MKEMYYLCTTKTTNNKYNQFTKYNQFIMNRQEILDVVKSLAMSQGYYGRLYDALTNGTEYALQEMEEQNFKDAVDMIMWLEC